MGKKGEKMEIESKSQETPKNDCRPQEAWNKFFLGAWSRNPSCQHLDFKLGGNAFLLFEGTKFIAICYDSPRKLQYYGHGCWISISLWALSTSLNLEHFSLDYFKTSEVIY